MTKSAIFLWSSIDIDTIQSGNNSGNRFFIEAAKNLTKAKFVKTQYDDGVEDYDTLILPMANFMSPHYEEPIFYDYFSKSKVPNIVLFSVGVQSEIYERIQLPESTVKFLKLASERSKSIGVRGYFTAEVLNDHGIKNVDVIGCPSLFMEDNPDFQFIPREKASFDRPAIGCTPSGYFRDAINKLYGFGMKYNAEYVLQSESEIITAIDDNKHGKPDNSEIEFFLNYYRPYGTTYGEFKDYLYNHSNGYESITDWIDAMRNKTISIGSRFHGGIASILAQTPHLMLLHDARVRELAEYFFIPSIRFEEFDEDISIEEANSLMDYSLFNRVYKDRFYKFNSWMVDNNIAKKTLFSVTNEQESIIAKRVKWRNINDLQRITPIGESHSKYYQKQLDKLRIKLRPVAVRKLVEDGEKAI